MRYRPRSSVTTIFTNFVGRSAVSAITQTPASGPAVLVTTPARSSASILMASPACRPAFIGACCAARISAKPAAIAPVCSTRLMVMSGSLLCERIRTNLELYQLSPRSLAPFDMPHEMCAVIRVEGAAFPAAVRIVDAAVEAARVEPERIRDAQRDPFFRLQVQHEQRVGIRSGRDRRVRAEAADVVLVDPVV